MTFLHSIILGIIQGLTEFLPVSSSGHLVITSAIYKIIAGHELLHANGEEIFTDIILHLGTLVAVVFYFRKEILNIIKAFWSACKTKDFSSLEAKMPLYLVLGTFFTILIAFPLNELCEHIVSSPVIVGFFLLMTGIVLFVSEKLTEKKAPVEKAENITLKQAIIIGIAQGIAAFPGMSRSAMTISAGLLTGLDRITAARYSFLLSILIIIGSSVFYPILKLEPSEILSFNWGGIFVGFIVSMIVGYFCIKYFLQFLNKYSMKVFAYYCWIVGICVIIYFGFISQ